MPKTANKPKPKTKKPEQPVNLRQELQIKDKTKQSSSLPGVWKLSAGCLKQLWDYRLLFIGILLVYGVINFAIAQGFSSGLSVTSLKSQLGSLFKGSQLSGGLAVYTLMLTSFGTGGSSSSGNSAFALVMLVVGSLAIIWGLRNAANKARTRIRDAYYRGMYPLVPFVLIMLLIAVELLPMILGISIYAIAINDSIAITVIEKIGFGLLALLFTALSIYLLSSTIFALYISTLPDMTPIKALKSASDLVKKRRLPIILRLIYLPFALLIVSAAIMLPLIIFAAPVAPWVYMLLSLVLLAAAHSYLYNLYRELLE